MKIVLSAYIAKRLPFFHPKPRDIRYLIFDIFLVVLFLPLFHCAASRFPVIPPQQKTTREEAARHRAQSHFIKALDFDRRGLTQFADRYFQSAYALDPASSTLRDLLVRRYINNGRYREAILLIKKEKKAEQLPVADQRLLAQVYLKMGRFQDAAAVLEMIPQKSDEEIFSLALIYEAQGAFNKSLDAYRAYLRRTPASLEVGLKISYLLIKTKHFIEAESLLVELSGRFPDNPAIFDALGISKLSAGDTALALNFFESALLADSLYEDALRNAAQIYLQRNNTEKAALYYERLAALRSYGSIYAKTLVQLHYFNENFDKARNLARRLLIESDLNDPDLHYYLGLIASAQNDSDLAVLEFEKTLALQPTFTNAWRSLCSFYLRRRKLDEALSVALRFTDEMPENGVAWRTLGVVHSARKEYVKAMTPLHRAVALDSMDYGAWFELGSVLERRAQYDSAAIAFRTVLKIRPGDPAAANYLGYMWAERGMHLDSARLLLRMALDQEPDNGAYLDSYAWIFYQMGDYDQALIYIKKALEHIQDDAVVLEHYGDILVKHGDFSGALDAYEKSLKLGSEDAERISNKIDAAKKNLQIE